MTRKHDWRPYLRDDEEFRRKLDRMIGSGPRIINDPRYMPPNPEAEEAPKQPSALSKLLGMRRARMNRRNADG